MNRINSVILIIVSVLILSGKINAQEKLYSNEFPLKDVQLLDGPFKHARDLNIQGSFGI